MNVPVYLYVPNLVGYFRIICSFLAFHFAGNWLLFFGFYMTSFLFDAVDGYAARKLNQSSKMGAVLDMVTDRFSTAGLLTILSGFYPTYRLFFIFLMALDICSHYAQMNAQLLRGADSHKKVDKSLGLLHLYYTDRRVLGLVCLSAELVYVFLYVLHFYQGPALFHLDVPYFGHVASAVHLAHLGLFASAPLWLLKQYLNVKQLVSAMLSMDAPLPAAAAAKEPTASASIASPVRTNSVSVPAAVNADAASPAQFSVRVKSPGKPRGRSVSRTRK